MPRDNDERSFRSEREILYQILFDMKRVAKPDAPFLVVGPDVFRTIDRYAAGLEPAHIVKAVLEHQDMNYQPGRENESKGYIYPSTFNELRTDGNRKVTLIWKGSTLITGNVRRI